MASVEKVDLWGAIEPNVKQALGSDADSIQAEFERGQITGWKIGTAWALLRAENTELVIVAMQGKDLATATHIIKQSAIQQGFKTLRAHTQSRALLRLIQQSQPNAYLSEYVLRMGL